MHTSNKLTAGLVVAGIFVVAIGVASANHAWGPYHWARTSNPFTLTVADNVSSAWDPYLDTAIADWSQSSVMDLTKVAGTNRPKNCRPTSGRIEACSARYGNNGWLGIAQIWVNGSHITQATVKVNDYYFNQPSYNTPGWRSLVMCQEIGHDFGLGHQDENFNNPPITPHTCMDYFVPGTNEIVHPNQHDYEQLETIYGHTDGFTTISALAAGSYQGPASETDDSSEWGRAIRYDDQARPSLYVRHLGLGRDVFTHVFWAE